MNQVTIVHLSDIHFSETDFWKGCIEERHGPHRSGHRPETLIALDRKLKTLSWDKLVISGDLSRIGHEDSFGYLKNWLYGTIKAPNGLEIGLNLDEKDNDCVVVPGNHDCFNEKLRQQSLENYEKFFPRISGSKTVKTRVNGITVNFHLYDSTYAKGGFAKGFVNPTDFSHCVTNDEILDIVVVHHHLAQSPKHKRHKYLELLNVDAFLAYLLSENINAVLFGHTHERMFDKVSADMLKKQIVFKRKYGRWLRKIFPKQWFSQHMHSLSFDRVPTSSGRYPTFDNYFEYLYLKNILRIKVSGPEEFQEPRHFYEHIKSFRSDYAERIIELKKKKVAFSMSPSPCYCGEEANGFHFLTFRKDSKGFLYDCGYYEWDGNDFVIKKE